MMDVFWLSIWILAAAFAFAKVEVQIEGEHGWAAKLPTWRIEKHPLLDIFWGGRPITGYHVWMFLFMAIAFHFPLVVGRPSWTLEARVFGALCVFWVVEDFLWFVINPAFGIRKFRPAHIPWHKRWIGPMPVDYLVFGGIGVALIAASCPH